MSDTYHGDVEYILGEMDKLEDALAKSLEILSELVALSDEQDAGGCDADKHDEAILKAKSLLQYYESLVLSSIDQDDMP